MGAIDIARKFASFSTQSAAASGLVAVAISANCITIILSFLPVYTFVKPVMKKESVGDRMVYANLIPFINSVMWALYASKSIPFKTFFFVANVLGSVLQIIYTIVYIRFADSSKRTQAILLSVAFGAFATIMIAIRCAHPHWGGVLIDVIASVSGVSTHIFAIFHVINNMNPITPLISFSGACCWTAYGLKSTPMNLYIVVPNITGILSGAWQIAVYLKYRMAGRTSAKIHPVKVPASPV